MRMHTHHLEATAMHFLPKANPLYEHISALKVNVPEIIEKLGKGGFTGYLSHNSSNFEAYCIFAKGKLLCAFANDGTKDKTGFEAISLLFDHIFADGGEIDVYRMTADLAMCAHALVLGSKIHNSDEVRQVDIKGMLGRLKTTGLNGAVHFYTKERYAMIFYKEGQPIGFYHDSARAIETSPEESRKVAALPGARLDVCSTKPLEELMHYDLLQMVNLGKLWETARSRHAATSKAKEIVAPIAATGTTVDDSKLAELAEDLKEVAVAYLSREGRMVVERRLKELGGDRILLDDAKITQLLKLIESDTAAMDDHARIEEMIDLMKSEIAGRLAV